jgi:hypothetical protein
MLPLLSKTDGQWQQITSLCHLRIYLWKMWRQAEKVTPLKHMKQMRVCAKEDHHLIILSSDANLIGLQRELKSVMSREFFF